MSVPDADSAIDQVGQVESLDGTDDPVDENVIAADDDDSEKVESPPEASQPSSTPPEATMPFLTNLADITLHSPSSMIVGTPFSDVHSTRFEYPFPDKPSTSELPSSNSPPPTSPTFSSISSSSSSAMLSASQPQLVLNPPPTLHHYPASFPPPPPDDLPNYSATHPKMRAVNPPVPPALVKRRQRWSLGLGSLSRKLSLRSGNAPTGQVTPGSPDPEADRRDETGGNAPLGSPRLDGPSTSKDTRPGDGGTFT
ncbi:hypothetical protein B0H11DRAFT_519001 [Mycena galericulata]|nr:hypothetical protein B0H11DRAFT_519001 [Mycena galericulata]